MISGRVWKFGDSINTDMMMPGPALYLPEAERIRYVFQASSVERFECDLKGLRRWRVVQLHDAWNLGAGT